MSIFTPDQSSINTIIKQTWQPPSHDFINYFDIKSQQGLESGSFLALEARINNKTDKKIYKSLLSQFKEWKENGYMQSMVEAYAQAHGTRCLRYNQSSVEAIVTETGQNPSNQFMNYLDKKCRNPVMLNSDGLPNSGTLAALEMRIMNQTDRKLYELLLSKFYEY